MRFWLGFLLLPIVFASDPSFAQGPAHVISGHVREEGSNTPLQAVKLEILSSGGHARPSVNSDTNGAFAFQGVSDGDYPVVASKTGYDTGTVTVTVLRSDPMSVTIMLHKTAPSKVVGFDSAVSARELTIPQKAREAFESGRKLLEEEKKPAESIPEFQNAIRAYPSYYEAYTEIGVANYSLRHSREAEEALKKAVQLSSQKYLKPLYLLADLYNGQQRYAEAEPLARQAVELDNSAWNGHFELARALVGLKRGVEAEASASKCRELKPDNAPVYLVLANAHILEQNYSAVVQDYESYLKLEPTGLLSDNIRQRRERLQNELRHAAEKKDAGPH